MPVDKSPYLDPAPPTDRPAGRTEYSRPKPKPGRVQVREVYIATPTDRNGEAEVIVEILDSRTMHFSHTMSLNDAALLSRMLDDRLRVITRSSRLEPNGNRSDS